jgi:hypothetical protein
LLAQLAIAKVLLSSGELFLFVLRYGDAVLANPVKQATNDLAAQQSILRN